MLSKEQLGAFALDIKKKKELSALSDTFIVEQIKVYLQKEPKTAQQLTEKFNTKSAIYRETLKRIREKLRRSYGLFRAQYHPLELLIHYDNATANEQSKILHQMLETHSSTKERLATYKMLYSRIFATTGKPSSILDLACGLNPLSLPLMNLKKVHYFAYDINTAEIDLLNQFFAKYHQHHCLFHGQAAVFDLHQIDKIPQLPSADVAFLWKIVDVLDANRGHTKSEAVIKAVPAQWVVVSFATKTMSGKAMTAPKRRWMEWMCKRLGYEYSILEYDNEIFYVIQK